MTETRKLRVFLCHSSQDKPIVRELYQRLNAEGWIDPWLDEEKLLPGQDWDMEIEKAVEVTDAVIVCLSNHSVTKEGVVQKEIRRALDKAEEKPEDVIFIIPLRLDDCPVPRRLKSYQYQDYFKAVDLAYKRLCVSLEIRANALRIDIIGIKENIQRLTEERSKREREEFIRREAKLKVLREEGEKIRKDAEESTRKSLERIAKNQAEERMHGSAKLGSSYSGKNEVNVRSFKTYGLIEINGRIDPSNATRLSDAFESTTNAGQFKILVDMTNLLYMSSSGFRALLAAQRNCKRYNRGEVILVGVPERLREALELAGFTVLFRMFEDVREAVGSF